MKIYFRMKTFKELMNDKKVVKMACCNYFSTTEDNSHGNITMNMFDMLGKDLMIETKQYFARNGELKYFYYDGFVIEPWMISDKVIVVNGDEVIYEPHRGTVLKDTLK